MLTAQPIMALFEALGDVAIEIVLFTALALLLLTRARTLSVQRITKHRTSVARTLVVLGSGTEHGLFHLFSNV